MKSSFSKYTFCLASALTLGACSDSSDLPFGNVDGEFQAAITGVSADFGSSEISLANTVVEDDILTLDVDESDDSYDIVNGYAAQDLSDIGAVAHGKYFYRLGRSSQDHITKYSFANPSVEEWQYSVNDADATGANPHDLVVVDDNKAYVIRYGASSVLIIDPSVGSDDEEGFILGKVDLSAYDADGIPQMHKAVLYKNRLYIVLQAQDENYVPGQAYLVAINTDTDEEVSIGEGELAGLALNVKNPVDLDLHGKYLYVSGIGRYGSSFSTPPRPAEYTGGIEKISVRNHSAEVLVDDGDDSTHPYGQISGMTIVSDDLAYFSGYNGWKDSSLFQFDPSTGEVVVDPVTSFANVDLRALVTSPEGEVWIGIGDDVAPSIKVLNSSNNSVIAEISTNKIPSGISFSGDLSED
jgi:hypothetical protein